MPKMIPLIPRALPINFKALFSLFSVSCLFVKPNEPFQTEKSWLPQKARSPPQVHCPANRKTMKLRMGAFLLLGVDTWVGGDLSKGEKDV